MKDQYVQKFRNLGRYEEAKKLELEIIKAFEEIHGRSHEITLRAKSEYAKRMSNVGDDAEA